MTVNPYDELESSRLTSDNFHAVQEIVHAHLWTDGLPVIPPEPQLVSACLEFAMLSPRHLVGIEPVRERAVTAEKLAVNAVMAGCLPEYMPVLIAAVKAITEPDFNIHGIQTTTNPVSPLLIINGPVRELIRLNSGRGTLGPGYRANATIGRAVRLMLMNIGGAKPWSTDMAVHGGSDDVECREWPLVRVFQLQSRFR